LDRADLKPVPHGKAVLALPEQIHLIAFDFDGVFTDNRVLTLQDGTEAVFCNRSDGLGIEMIRRLGIPMLILSTEANPVVRARARKIRLEVNQGLKDKKSFLQKYCERRGYHLNHVAYVGNDVNDLEVMQAVGWPLCPLDAHPKIKRVSKLIIDKKGGQGVIRRLADILVQTRR